MPAARSRARLTPLSPRSASGQRAACGPRAAFVARQQPHQRYRVSCQRQRAVGTAPAPLPRVVAALAAACVHGGQRVAGSVLLLANGRRPGLAQYDRRELTTAGNRGVPGSSPGLAIVGVPATRLFLVAKLRHEMSGYARRMCARSPKRSPNGPGPLGVTRRIAVDDVVPPSIRSRYRQNPRKRPLPDTTMGLR
jgi:hypothetical protein